MNIKDYFSSLFKGIWSLLQGLKVTGKEFVTPKITEQYPENQATLKISDRFRGELTLKYDAEGNHKCTACGLCMMNCPNGTIKVIPKMVEVDGKKKKKLDKYIYDLGSCIYCNLCVTNCAFHAIEFSNNFEQAVFDRNVLVKQLNYLPEKEEPVKPAAPKPAVAPAEKKAEAKPATAPAEKKAEAKPATAPAEKKAEAKPATAPAEKKAETKPATAPAEKKAEAKPATVKKTSDKKDIKPEK